MNDDGQLSFGDVPEPGLHVEDLDAPHAWVRRDASGQEVTAAMTIARATGSKYRRAIVRAHYEHPGGLTDDDVARILNMPNLPPPRVASRRLELVEMGWLRPVRRDGKPVLRRTRTGHPAQVWTLTAEAWRLVSEGALDE